LQFYLYIYIYIYLSLSLCCVQTFSVHKSARFARTAFERRCVWTSFFFFPFFFLWIWAQSQLGYTSQKNHKSLLWCARNTKKTVKANKFVVCISLSISLKRELSSFFFHLWLLCLLCLQVRILSFARMGFCVFWSEWDVFEPASFFFFCRVCVHSHIMRVPTHTDLPTGFIIIISPYFGVVEMQKRPVRTLE
jgi:hypothetical protein